MKNNSGVALPVKRFVTTILILINITGIGAQDTAGVDSILNTLSLKEKIELILIAVPPGNTTDKWAEKAGFTLLSPDSSASASAIFPLASRTILDARNGFITHSVLPPFPDIRAISVLKNEEDRGFLKKDLLHHLSTHGFSGVLASGKYLFGGEVRRRDGRILPEIPRLALWFPVLEGREVMHIPATYMPEDLFVISRNHLSRAPDHKDMERVIVWPPSLELLKSEFSFEKRIKEGFLFLTRNYAKDFSRLWRAYDNKWLNGEDLDRSCRHVLRVIQEVQDESIATIPPQLIYTDLVRRKTLEDAIRLFQGDAGPFPLTGLSHVSVAVVADSDVPAREEFTSMVARYLSPTEDPSKANLVFWLTGKRNVDSAFINERVSGIRQKFKAARVVMFRAGNPSYLDLKNMPAQLDGLIAGSSNYPFVWESMAQVAFSGLEVNLCTDEEGWNSKFMNYSRALPATRLKYGVPLEVGLHPDSMLRIDEIVRKGISDKAMPGARVMVACRGVVVWDKAYGWHTYKRNQPVQEDDLYDLASVTKVTATLPALMKLYDEGKWVLTDTLSRFFPEADTTDKSGIVIKDLLLHESGLPAFIPLYLNTIDRKNLRGSLFSRRYSSLYSIKLDSRIYFNRTVSYRRDLYNTQQDSLFSVPVAHQFFLNHHYLDSINIQMLSSPLRTHHTYLYSDLGFYFLGEMVPRISGMPMNQYVSNYFYAPMGAQTTTFLPLNNFPPEKIIPTEQDDAFRKQLLRGWVHDPGAAMMGGVAGHAGLFSSAGDLAKIMQMFLNKGSYGGVRFLKPETIDAFTQTQNGQNRRGLGFDKPDTQDASKSSASKYASSLSFGHTGFTGTMVWVDPAVDLVYVFLSNRVHPHQYNRKLIEENIRTRVHDVIYKSLIIRKDEPEIPLESLKALTF